jgi:hypothetical protein
MDYIIIVSTHIIVALACFHQGTKYGEKELYKRCVKSWYKNPNLLKEALITDSKSLRN